MLSLYSHGYSSNQVLNGGNSNTRRYDVVEAINLGAPVIAIRNRQSGKVLMHVNYGYGGPTGSGGNVLWNNDDQLVALQTLGTKGYSVVQVFHLQGDKIEEITLPNYQDNIAGRLGVLKLESIHEKLTTWKNEELTIDVSTKVGITQYKDFRVKISFTSGKPIRPYASLTLIEEKNGDED